MTTIGPFQLNTIVTGDCAEMMSALPDGCIDLTVTSPPYDSLREYRGYTFDFEAIAAQLWRVTKPGGVGVWVVGDETKDGSESGTSFRQALGFMAAGFNLHDTMIYQKRNPPPQLKHTARYTQAFDYMFIFSKGTIRTVNYITVPNETTRTSRQFYGTRNEDGKRARNRYGTRLVDKILTNIWTYNIGNCLYKDDDSISAHPAIFPESLARDHILSWSNPGDVVLDPMVGSGTTAKQAHLLGRHYLGFDISAEYCELARRRVANVEAQPFLMPPSAETNGHKPEQAALFAEAA